MFCLMASRACILIVFSLFDRMIFVCNFASTSHFPKLLPFHIKNNARSENDSFSLILALWFIYPPVAAFSFLLRDPLYRAFHLF